MRRSNNEDISSVDLLLDTMCNTFGGIVFIALLLSILSSSIRESVPQEDVGRNNAIEKVDRRIQTARLLREQQEVQEAVRHLEVTLNKTADRAGNPGLELLGVQATNDALRLQRESLAQTNSLLASEIARMEDTVRRNQTTSQDLRIQIEKLRASLREKHEESTRTVRLPRVHVVADKTPVFVAIQDGKFYAVSKIGGTRQRYSGNPYDLDEVAVEQGPGMDIIEMRSGAGQVVSPNCEQRGKLSQALLECDPASQYVQFAVATNSFAAFNYVKAVFVNKGFEYNWVVSAGVLRIVKVSADNLTAQ